MARKTQRADLSLSVEPIRIETIRIAVVFNPLFKEPGVE